jgi:hypothetical protein
MKRQLSVLLALAAVTASFGQIKSPEEFLGYPLGERFTRHHRVVDYYEYLASASANLQLQEYGRTYEDRPLLIATIASDENTGRIEQIREDNLRRAGLLDGSPATNVGIVWLSYNVHGNEANSTEASMLTVYKLLTEHKDWLENTVVIIDPCLNPDGRDRYVNFFDQTGQLPFNPDPQAAEHNEPWPGGRQNHYIFDLNRDWAWQTQVESKQRIALYNQWLPQVHVDFHEQGYNSPYYFAPAAEPYHELITNWQREFQDIIGRNNAKYFDANNWFYFTKQHFDLLYPSYGDTYPTYSGAIGMTYEQGGIRAGLGIITNDGDTLTLLDRLTHHTTAGLSTIEISAKNNQRLIQEFQKFYSTPVSGDYKTFVVRNDNQDKINHLKRWLDTHQITYGTATGTRGMKGYNYQTRQLEPFSISSSDLVVSVNQPKGVLARILFEPVTYYSDSLTYDITAWSVPYFYGLQAYATTALNVRPLPDQAKAAEPKAPAKAYAFLAEWKSFEDAKFLAALLNENIKVRFTDRAIAVGGRNYDRGTMIISTRDNAAQGDKFHSTVTRIAANFEQSLDITATGYMDQGPDIGSGNVHLVNKPSVAMLRGDGVSSTNYGATWYYLEQELQYPFTALNVDELNWTDLDAYDVLIMQEGRYGALGEPGMKKINDWVQAGGKLIAIGSSLRQFADSDYTSLSRYGSEEEKNAMKEKAEKDREAAKLMPYGDSEREWARNMVPGAVFRVTLDNTHPLAYGYGKTYYSLKTSGSRYGYLGSQNVGIIKSASDHLSGFAGKNVLDGVGESMVFGVENKGRGQIVYFVDNPLFRAFWQNGKLMIANALFYVGQD